MKSTVSADIFRRVYISPLFVIAALFAVYSSYSMTNALTQTTLAELSRYGTQEAAFQIIYMSVLRELVPISVGLLLSWLLVMNCQYKINKGGSDSLDSIASHILFVFTLLGLGVLVSVAVAYFKVDVTKSGLVFSALDVVLPVIKGMCFALVFFTFRQFHLKYSSTKKTVVGTAFVCAAIIFGNMVSVFLVNFIVNSALT